MHDSSKKELPRPDLTDDELKKLCVVAIRQHRDDCRRWASLRVGLSNHLGHAICQELETWTASFYATKRRVPLDSDVEDFASQLIEKNKGLAEEKKGMKGKA